MFRQIAKRRTRTPIKSRTRRFPFLFLLGNTNLRRAFRSITLIEGNNSSPDARYLRLISRDNISGLREIF